MVENCLALAGVNGKCLLPSFAEPLASAPMAQLDGKHPLQFFVVLFRSNLKE